MHNQNLFFELSQRAYFWFRSRVNVVKLVLVPVCLFSMSMVACQQPCATLAKQVCETNGPDSTECMEVKTFADQAGITERSYCQTALSVIKTFGNDG